MKTLITFLFLSTISFGQTVNSFIELVTYPTTEEYVHMLGYYDANDGGGGLFYLEDTSTAGPEDRGIVFQSTSDPTKSWIRVIPDNKINVRWFGAKGNGDDNTLAVQAIRDYIQDNKGNVLYFPSGDYRLKSILLNNLDEGLKIVGDGRNSKIIGDHPRIGNGIFRVRTDNVEIQNLSFYSNNESVGITTEQNAKNIVLNKLYFEGNLETAVKLFSCSYIQILNSKFNTVKGYQILQVKGHTANNVLVQGNQSNNCSKDFVELNSEINNPSENWIITENIVRNINDNTGNPDERRFIGITATSGVVISNNIFEKCFGDAAFHFEKITGDITITNNVIRDPNGSFGSLIANYDNQGTGTIRYINFSNNLVEFSNTYSSTGTATELIYSDNVDKTIFNINNNKFVNNSGEDLNILHKSNSSDTHCNFIGNEVRGFKSAIIIGDKSDLMNINNNTFIDTECAIKLDSTSKIEDNSLNIQNNTFKNIGNVFKSDDGKVNLLSMSNNVFDNSSLNFDLDASFLSSFKNNIFKNGSTTNYRNSQISINVPNDSSSNIFSIKKEDYTFICWVEIQANTGFADRTRHLLRVSRNEINPSNYNNHVSILDQTRNGNYPLPDFFVNEDGLNATITGSSGSTFKVKVSVIDIDGLLIIDEESLGSIPVVQSSPSTNRLSESIEPVIFENSISYEQLVKLFPNPTENDFLINIKGVDIYDDINVYDINGRLVKSFSNIKSKDPISVSDIGVGTYIVMIYFGDKMEVKKIVKK